MRREASSSFSTCTGVNAREEVRPEVTVPPAEGANRLPNFFWDLAVSFCFCCCACIRNLQDTACFIALQQGLSCGAACMQQSATAPKSAAQPKGPVIPLPSMFSRHISTAVRLDAVLSIKRGRSLVARCREPSNHAEQDEQTPARAFFTQGTQSNGVFTVYVFFLCLVEIHPADGQHYQGAGDLG